MKRFTVRIKNPTADRLRIGDIYYTKDEAMLMFLRMGLFSTDKFFEFYGRPVSWDEIFDVARQTHLKSSQTS